MNVKVEIPLDIIVVVAFPGFMRRRRAVSDIGRCLRIGTAVGTDMTEYRTAHRSRNAACDRTEHRFDISRDIAADASENISCRADDIAADYTEHVAADISIDIPADVSEQIVTENGLMTLMVTHNMRDAIAYGNRLIMMHEGRIILDIKGEEKKNLTVEMLLEQFAKASGDEFTNDRALLS